MGYDYDKLYGKTRNALGKPTAEFVEFFQQLDQQNLRVLDVGCGQGRDALFIAKAGHRVVGVDISANGIRDLTKAAMQKNLLIQGIVADIATYVPDGQFDVIVIDRTLHMLDRPARLIVLENLLCHVGKDGWLLIADEPSNMADFEAVIAADNANWAPSLSKKGYMFLRRD